jgi:hypothetical protein
VSRINLTTPLDDEYGHALSNPSIADFDKDFFSSNVIGECGTAQAE